MHQKQKRYWRAVFCPLVQSHLLTVLSITVGVCAVTPTWRGIASCPRVHLGVCEKTLYLVGATLVRVTSRWIAPIWFNVMPKFRWSWTCARSTWRWPGRRVFDVRRIIFSSGWLVASKWTTPRRCRTWKVSAGCAWPRTRPSRRSSPRLLSLTRSKLTYPFRCVLYFQNQAKPALHPVACFSTFFQFETFTKLLFKPSQISFLETCKKFGCKKAYQTPSILVDI